ncbi:hypothetical protein ACIQNU_03935 [Streptomyces sp. NPDC091292]|uniref:hypothetical protein n=1 Tax=Streptomyces sp. NPDC091292 TaxID=3365991 RepID=UPI0038141811
MTDYPEVTAWLVKKAREFRAEGTPASWAQADAAAGLASKIARGAVRPNNLRMIPDPGFFEAGRTYAHGDYRFACEYLTTHPTSGRISAWGWFGKNDTWRHASFGARQYEVREWVDVTTVGESPAQQHYDKVPDPADGCHWCACGNRWPCKDAKAVAA